MGDWEVKNGSFIRVNVDLASSTLVLKLMQPVCVAKYSASIPEKMRGKDLFSVVHLYCANKHVVKFV